MIKLKKTVVAGILFSPLMTFAQTDALNITSAGNVAIGAVSSGKNLFEVYGKSLLSNNVTIGGFAANTTLDCKLSVNGGAFVVGNPPSTLPNQGVYIFWNKDIGSGQANFINHRGLGAGGFKFESTWEQGTQFKTLMNIDGDGNTTVAGDIKDKSGYVTPKGGIIMYDGDINNFDGTGKGKAGTPVEGWALCNGDNTTPDLRNRFIVGAGTGSEYTLAQKGGEKTHQLTEAEMPSHSHSIGVGGGHKDTRDNVAKIGNSEGWGCTTCIFTTWTSRTGGNVAHENRPPYYALYYIKKL